MDHFLLVWWHRNTYTTFVAIVVLIAYPLSEHIRKVPEQMLSEEYQLQHRTIATAGSLSHLEARPSLRISILVLMRRLTLFPQRNTRKPSRNVFDTPQAFGVDPAVELRRIFERKSELVMGTWL